MRRSRPPPLAEGARRPILTGESKTRDAFVRREGLPLLRPWPQKAENTVSRPADPKARIALLRAAQEVFAEKGLEATKVEEITRRAGTSKGAFYSHFESKEIAFRDVVESFVAQCVAKLKPPSAYEDLPKSAAGMLAFALDKDVEIFEYLWQSRGLLSMLEGCHGPHVYLLRTFQQELEGNAESWVETWKTVGLVRQEIPTPVLAPLLCGAYHELVHRMLASAEKPPIRAWLQEAQSILVAGMGTSQMVAAVHARNQSAATLSSSGVGETSRHPTKTRKSTRVATARG